MREEQGDIRSDIARLANDIKWIKDEIKEIKENHLTSIYSKLNCLDKKLNSRPSWFVAIVITFLTSLLLALIIYTLTGG